MRAWPPTVWGVWFLVFVALELAGAAGAPWGTLSAEAWRLESLWDGVRILFLAGLAVLLVHIVFRWP